MNSDVTLRNTQPALLIEVQTEMLTVQEPELLDRGRGAAHWGAEKGAAARHRAAGDLAHPGVLRLRQPRGRCDGGALPE